MASHTDEEGWVEKSCTFSDLQKGTYLVQEDSCSRFRLSAITDITQGNMIGSISDGTAQVRFQFQGRDRSAGAVFENEKYEWGSFTGSDLCINQFGTP